MAIIDDYYSLTPTPPIPESCTAHNQMEPFDDVVRHRHSQPAIYIAGPMSGYEDYNFPAFDRAADAFTAFGWRVSNPADSSRAKFASGAEVKPGTTVDYRDFIPGDIADLALCDAIALLPGWDKSKGARLEVQAAKMFGLDFYDAETGEQLADPELPNPNKLTLEFELPPGARYTPRFVQLCADLIRLHIKKATDYGSDADPLANVRSTQECGVPPWVGVLIRSNDKTHRLKEFARKGVLANESAEDSMMDNAAYFLIMRILYEDELSRELNQAA